MRRMFGEGGVRLLFGGRPLRSHCTGRGRARPVQVLQPFRCPRHKQIAPNCPEENSVGNGVRWVLVLETWGLRVGTDYLEGLPRLI